MKSLPSLTDMYDFKLTQTPLKMDNKKVFIVSADQMTHRDSVTHWFRLNNGLRIMYEIPKEET